MEPRSVVINRQGGEFTGRLGVAEVNVAQQPSLYPTAEAQRNARYTVGQAGNWQRSDRHDPGFVPAGFSLMVIVVLPYREPDKVIGDQLVNWLRTHAHLASVRERVAEQRGGGQGVKAQYNVMPARCSSGWFAAKNY